METDQSEDSKMSREENDRREPLNNDTRSARFYECTFCKRGFPTAQALGGHMNIHRSERSRRHSFPAQTQSFPPFHSPFSDALKNYQMYYPTPTTRPPPAFPTISPRQLSLFTEKPSSGPGSGLGSGSSLATRTNDEEELDLELRLGHEP